MFRVFVLVLIGAAAGTTVAEEPAPEFKTDVMPVLTKAGCNSAACHGAAIGRGGLRLSLLGYDAEYDFDQLVNQYKARRVNRADPDKSLMLLKPSRQVSHQGGRRLPLDDEGYEIVKRWITAGAKSSVSRELVGLEISPKTLVLNQVGDEFQVEVVARYNDGSTRDVTTWTLFEPNDKEALRSTKNGKVKVLQRGQSALMIRYLGQVGNVTVTVPLADAAVSQARPRANLVDDHVNRVLDQLRLENSPRADDATFVRRIYLDLIGTLPTPQESRAFQVDADPEKRLRLINELMDRNEFVDHWSYKWGDLLRIESRRLGSQGAEAYHKWLREQVATNQPLDDFVRQLLLAFGDASQIGEANFYRVPTDALQQAEHFSQVFMGVRLQCANCHNHPLDRWTQDDYHGLAAIFARVERGQQVEYSDRGEVIHPKTNQPAVARIPGSHFIESNFDPRHELLRWIKAENNPYFARNIVNRLWRELMGRGLVEPVDDHRATNPASHPQLLDALAEQFIANGFDVRDILTTIATSEAYQRSSLSTGNNETDQKFYSRGLRRPLPPPVMVDAVSAVTGVPEELGADSQTAIALGDSRIRSRVLDLLGRCARDASCATDGGPGADSLPLTLHIINGRWLNEKLEHADGFVAKSLANNAGVESTIERLYWVAYSRPPSPEEREYWQDKLSVESPDAQRDMLCDLMWAVLNSTEFRFNH